jgi:hypothetical protein
MDAEPTNLHRYQESEYAAGRETSAFRLEFVGFLTSMVINHRRVERIFRDYVRWLLVGNKAMVELELWC